MSFADTLLVLSIVLKSATPVVVVLLYAAALASAVFMLRDRGNGGH